MQNEIKLPDEMGFTDTTGYRPTHLNVYKMSGENIIVARFGSVDGGTTVVALSPEAWQVVVDAVSAHLPSANSDSITEEPWRALKV